jgi:mevalonate kinase
LKISDSITSRHFFSKGKLLLSGEYLVVKGALALAVPLKVGQKMEVLTLEDDKGIILWKSYQKNELWFEAQFSVIDLQILESSDQQKAENLQKILQAATRLNPSALFKNQSFEVKTDLDFSPEWGFGSSSTLLSNVAYWFGIDPFNLHFLTSDGSGYDVACARASRPLTYQLTDNKPVVIPVPFHPPFKDQIYFVYLCKKQESAQSLKTFRDMLVGREREIQRISEITKRMILAQNIRQFEETMDEHEEIMCSILKLPKAKDLYFAGFQGSVKSLGAWGGDFVLMTWKYDRESFETEIKARGFSTFFSFDEVVLDKPKL